MLEAKTQEQRGYVEEIVGKYLKPLRTQDFKFLYGHVYKNDNDLVEINITCGGCYNYISIDIPFDMMAEIVDYLREQDKEVK